MNAMQVGNINSFLHFFCFTRYPVNEMANCLYAAIVTAYPEYSANDCTFEPQSPHMKPTVIIEYCPKCNWLLRSAYMAQELLTTFADDLKAVSLQPSEVSGDFHLSIEGVKIFDRKDYGGFPEIKEIKQLVRNFVNPGKSLGHADTKSHHLDKDKS